MAVQVADLRGAPCGLLQAKLLDGRVLEIKCRCGAYHYFDVATWEAVQVLSAGEAPERHATARG